MCFHFSRIFFAILASGKLFGTRIYSIFVMRDLGMKKSVYKYQGRILYQLSCFQNTCTPRHFCSHQKDILENPTHDHLGQTQKRSGICLRRVEKTDAEKGDSSTTLGRLA